MIKRKDLVICEIPEVPKKKKVGRPKKYGDKIQPKLEDLNQGLTAEEIIKRYAQRWDIESMFNELKNRFRFKDIMMHTSHSYYQFLYFKVWCFIIIKLSSIEFKSKIRNYIEDFLPWRVHPKKGITITAGSTKLALRGVFSTLHIELLFPKVDENIDGNLKDDVFLGFDLGIGAEMSG